MKTQRALMTMMAW